MEAFTNSQTTPPNVLDGTKQILMLATPKVLLRTHSTQSKSNTKKINHLRLRSCMKKDRDGLNDVIDFGCYKTECTLHG